MITPTIHLNGTSRDELLHQYIAALEAIRHARNALCAMAPHPRDYYPQGEDAYPAARQEHDDRLASLDGLRMEIEELALSFASESPALKKGFCGSCGSPITFGAACSTCNPGQPMAAGE